jgi:hypothetical protein
MKSLREISRDIEKMPLKELACQINFEISSVKNIEETKPKKAIIVIRTFSFSCLYFLSMQ